MPLDKPGLQSAILAIFEDMASRTTDPEQAREDFATDLSNAIDAYVRTGLVITAGTATAQEGEIT